MSLYIELRKKSENDQFRGKPDPGLNLSGKIFVCRNSPHHVGSKYILFEKPDNRKKTGFQDPGYENWHKSCQNGTEQYRKRIKMINEKKTQSVEIRGTQQILREIHIHKIWISKN